MNLQNASRRKSFASWQGTGELFGFTSVISLVDQTVVSGTRFLTSVLVGRVAADEMGTYYLAFTVLLMTVSIQESLITIPFTIRRNRVDDDKKSCFRGAILVHQSILSLLVIVLGVVYVMTEFALGHSMWVAASLLIFLPGTLLREFARRNLFAELKMTGALAVDLGSCLIQSMGIIWLYSTGRLSASTALLTSGIACILSAVWWIWESRGRLEFPWHAIKQNFLDNWKLGRWLCGSQSITIVNLAVAPWILVFVHDKTTTGLYTAALSIVLLSNPFLLGIGNFLTPRLTKAFDDGGATDVRQVVFAFSYLVCGVMACFAFFVLFFGQSLIMIFGSQYTNVGSTISVLGFAMLALASGYVIDIAFQTQERPQLNLFTNLAGLAINILVTCLLVTHFRTVGAAIGWLVGNLCTSALRWIFFLTSDRRDSLAAENSGR